MHPLPYKYFNLGQSKFLSHSDWIVPLSETQELLYFTKCNSDFAEKRFVIVAGHGGFFTSVAGLLDSFLLRC